LEDKARLENSKKRNKQGAGHEGVWGSEDMVSLILKFSIAEGKWAGSCLWAKCPSMY